MAEQKYAYNAVLGAYVPVSSKSKGFGSGTTTQPPSGATVISTPGQQFQKPSGGGSPAAPAPQATGGISLRTGGEALVTPSGNLAAISEEGKKGFGQASLLTGQEALVDSSGKVVGFIGPSSKFKPIDVGFNISKGVPGADKATQTQLDVMKGQLGGLSQQSEMKPLDDAGIAPSRKTRELLAQEVAEREGRLFFETVGRPPSGPGFIYGVTLAAPSILDVAKEGSLVPAYREVGKFITTPEKTERFEDVGFRSYIAAEQIYKSPVGQLAQLYPAGRITGTALKTLVPAGSKTIAQSTIIAGGAVLIAPSAIDIGMEIYSGDYRAAAVDIGFLGVAGLSFSKGFKAGIGGKFIEDVPRTAEKTVGVTREEGFLSFTKGKSTPDLVYPGQTSLTLRSMKGLDVALRPASEQFTTKDILSLKSEGRVQTKTIELSPEIGKLPLGPKEVSIVGPAEGPMFLDVVQPEFYVIRERGGRFFQVGSRVTKATEAGKDPKFPTRPGFPEYSFQGLQIAVVGSEARQVFTDVAAFRVGVFRETLRPIRRTGTQIFERGRTPRDDISDFFRSPTRRRKGSILGFDRPSESLKPSLRRTAEGRRPLSEVKIDDVISLKTPSFIPAVAGLPLGSGISLEGIADMSTKGKVISLGNIDDTIITTKPYTEVIPEFVEDIGIDEYIGQDEIIIEDIITPPTRDINIPIPLPPVGFLPSVPGIPGFDIGGGGFGGARRRKEKGFQKFGYTPSIGGVLLGLRTGRTPKGIFSGIGIRPIVSRSRKTNKRGRRKR